MRLCELLMAGVLCAGLAAGFTALAYAQQVTKPPVIAPGTVQLPQATRVQPVAPVSGLPAAGPQMALKPGEIPVVLILRDGRQIGAKPASGINLTSSGGRQFPERDHDRDGADAMGHGGLDCNDDDASSYPGAPEVVDPEGKDNDCDPSTIGMRDIDGDGVMSWQAFNLLRDQTGKVYEVRRGADCDDLNMEVNPYSPEVIGNTIDDNCDGFVDTFDRKSHSDYCGPSQSARAADPKNSMCTPAR